MNRAPSEQLLGSSKRKKEQMMQRNRQLYRSNPNMTNFGLEDEDEPVDPVVRGNIASVSSINLCTETYHQGYLTLPTAKSLDKNRSEFSKQQPETFKMSLKPTERPNSSKRTFMRQALSQENLCMDSGGPLLDIRQNIWPQRDSGAKQTASHYSSFPIRSSVSTHDILSDNSPSTKEHHSGRTSCAGVWRTPFLQHSTPTPSIQPIRIDIPLTREVSTKPNPPLTTFKHDSSLLAAKTGQNLKLNGHKQSPQSQADHIYACPISAVKKTPRSSQQQKSDIHRDAAVKPHVSITPTKHVSFQEPPLHQRKSTGATRINAPPVMCDPWRKEAQEKLEEQQRLHMVELLQQEVQDLQAKAKRSAEENDRLRRLNLEWQFQKRLQEIQQRGEDEDEEDDDLDMMVTLQQLEKRAQAVNKRCSGVDENSEQKELDKHERTHLSQKKDEATDQTPTRLGGGLHKKSPKGNEEEKLKRAPAPEKLTFKERQRLFSLASSA